MKQFLLTVMLLILQIAGVQAENTVGGKAPEFTLRDQFEKTVSLQQYAGRAVVLIASDKEGSSQNAAWNKAVKGKYADEVAVQGIADVSSAPFFLKGRIRKDLRRDAESILLDWKGEVFKAYGMKKGVSNVILIDREGMIRHRTSGPAVPDAVQELFEMIDTLN